jgi:uncharacterized protein YbbC (DUF1343 family)
VEGPGVQHGFESFVGIHSIATRHGMTMGELARLYQKERGIGGDLLVIPCANWRRDTYFDDTGLPWVLPSPNMPTPATALVYPGQCLLEGTNLSEGRGTTRPLELCGAPWLEPKQVSERLQQLELPGVAFRPAWFQPTFQKHAGITCGGIQLHVMDRSIFRPLRTGLAVLAVMRELSGTKFQWRTEPYEFVADKPAIDLLFGGARERLALEAGVSPSDIAMSWEAYENEFRERRREFLLY